MAGIEGLFVQGEFLRAERVVELYHLRELQAEINMTGISRAGETLFEVTPVSTAEHLYPEDNLHNGSS